MQFKQECCFEEDSQDRCPTCNHSIIVFHGGNAPCFHTQDDNGEKFCPCDGPGEEMTIVALENWERIYGRKLKKE